LDGSNSSYVAASVAAGAETAAYEAAFDEAFLELADHRGRYKLAAATRTLSRTWMVRDVAH
jgi:hypothetical protein